MTPSPGETTPLITAGRAASPTRPTAPAGSHRTPFVNASFKIQADSAAKHLQSFVAYLKDINKPELIVQNTRGEEIAIGIDLRSDSKKAQISTITISNPEVYQKYINYREMEFNNIKNEAQTLFNTQLDELKSKLDLTQKPDGDLYVILSNAGINLFNNLSSTSTQNQVNLEINNFCKICEENTKAADKIMGHGWIFRVAEIIVKAIGGFFVGIGMVIGAFAGQGLAKAEHRQAYNDTFFTLHQTDKTKAINTFQSHVQDINAKLGNPKGLSGENEPDQEKPTPKK